MAQPSTMEEKKTPKITKEQLKKAMDIAREEFGDAVCDRLEKGESVHKKDMYMGKLETEIKKLDYNVVNNSEVSKREAYKEFAKYLDSDENVPIPEKLQRFMDFFWLAVKEHELAELKGTEIEDCDYLAVGLATDELLTFRRIIESDDDILHLYETREVAIYKVRKHIGLKIWSFKEMLEKSEFVEDK